VDHPDHAVLEVLQDILSGGRTARLYPALVDAGIASHAGGWDYENPDATVFALEVALRPGVSHERAEQALEAVIEDLKQTPPTARELQKAKNQTKADFVYASDGVTKLGQQIGYYHLIASYDYLRSFPGRVDAVTAEDISRVVRQYFVRENRTVGWLVADGDGGAEAGGSGSPQELRGYRAEGEAGAPGAGGGSLVPVPAGLGEVPPVHEIRLGNGLQLIVQENHSAPLAVMEANIMAGPAFDPKGKAGLAAFCAEMLSRGTTKRSWQEMREELEFVAADLGFGVGAQVGTASGRCLKADLRLLLEATAEQLMVPSFPEEEIEKVRSELIAAQLRRDEDTRTVADKVFFERLYPEGHPLHAPLLGTKESVDSITRDDLAAFHARYYRPENTILAVVGDVDASEVAEMVEQAFAAWERRGEPVFPEMFAVPAPAEPTTVPVLVPNKTQLDILIGFPGISRRDAAYYQADLMNYLLGRGFMSRLNMRIRDDLGLAYYVWSGFYAYWGAGPWLLHMGVNPANREKAVAAAIEELEALQAEAPSEEELTLWKDYVEGTVARQMETFSGIGQNLVIAAFYDLGLYFPYQYPKLLRSITPEQVQEAAKQFLHPEGYLAVIAGPVESGEGEPAAEPPSTE
jgi:zinc protease